MEMHWFSEVLGFAVAYLPTIAIEGIPAAGLVDTHGGGDPGPKQLRAFTKTTCVFKVESFCLVFPLLHEVFGPVYSAHSLLPSE